MGSHKSHQKQQGTYSGCLVHTIRALQGICAALVTAVLLYFILHTQKGSWELPWQCLFLLGVAILTLLTLVISGILICLGRVRPRYSAAANTVIALLWITAFVLVSLRIFETVKQPCSGAAYEKATGVSACILYKVFYAGAACAVLSSLAMLGLDISMSRRKHSRGKYVRASNPREEEDTVWLRASTKASQPRYDDSVSEYGYVMQSSLSLTDSTSAPRRRSGAPTGRDAEKYSSLYFGQVPMPKGSSQFVKIPAPEPVATARGESSSAGGFSLVGNGQATGFTFVGQEDNSDMPRIPENLARSVPTPEGTQLPATESNLPGFLALDMPQFAEASSISIAAPDLVENVTFRLSGLDEQTYKQKVLLGLDGTLVFDSPHLSFRDAHGYVLERRDERFETYGEATYFTAIAAAAYALDSYKSPRDNTNQVLAGLLDVLNEKSWGNRDAQGVTHPIRHPDWQEIHTSGMVRQRPMSKDAFGPIVAACYYAFNSPNTSRVVRTKARDLIIHWVTYLSTHNWTLHTNYFPGEFEKVKGEKQPGDTEEPAMRYKNIRSYEDGKVGGPSRYLGAESFLLLPCELYALKHCAESLSVPNNIAPWANASFAIGSNIPYHILPPVVAAAREGLRYVLDRLEFEKRYRIELIPEWEKGQLKGKLSLSIPESKKIAILDAFEKSIYDMLDPLFRDPTSIGSRRSPLFPDIISKLVPFFPDDLRVLPLNEILQDLLAQAMPWFQNDLLLEHLAFLLTFDPKIAKPDASLAGYTFWSMLMELETRPILDCLLRPLAASQYAALKAGKKPNPNGVWGAVCEDRAAVDADIQYFLDTGASSFNLKPYAWSKNYTEWLEKNDDPMSSRLDYFVLRALIDKGVPRRVPLNIKSMQIFINAAESLIRNTILNAVDEFKKTGKYFVMVTDAAGAAVQDLMDASVGFVRNIWRAGEQTSSTVHRLFGQVEQWRWKTGQGGIAGYTKWAKAPIEGLPPFADLLEHHIHDLDGVLRVWKWGKNMRFSEFAKYAGTGVDGAIDEAQKVIHQLRDLDGRLHQWISSRGQLRSYLGWINATAGGGVVVDNCVMHVLRDVSGGLKRWEYNAGHVLKNFNHWVTSNSLGNSDPSKLLQSAVRDPAGLLIQSIFSSGALQKEFHWAKSSVQGVGRAADCILVQVRGLDNGIEQWTLGGGAVKKYEKWLKADSSGAASSNDLVKIVNRLPDGKLIIISLKAGVQVAQKTTDGLGHVLKETGKIVDQANKPAKKLGSWLGRRLGL
ncbi:unnamed protein product [Clonostachys rosea]|uniref:Cellulase n=1 Tax=Bionectria ochroleuca TaxID=29856 RepID=A0ABY6UIM1_BIOOC|nr:unnamed protein product [Clonostachys rosea]